VSTIPGQALVLGNVTLFQYAGLVWLFFHAFVVLYEEPRLRATFKSDYDPYCRNVRAVGPPYTPWNGAP
jgi:protein-S-isoprenylcysteine O-methyltransferase Ste14